MSRGRAAGWLSCASVVLVLQILGLEPRYTKPIVFVVLAAYWSTPETSTSSAYLRHAAIVSGISLGFFLLLRSVLATTKTTSWTGPGKVLLFPSKTTHSRLFPEKHSFVYSYLVVGLPVGWEGESGGLVSSSHEKQSWFSLARRAWYHVNPGDYLDRGNGHLSLRGKLDAYLKSQVRTDSPDVMNLNIDQLSRAPIRPTFLTPTL